MIQQHKEVGFNYLFNIKEPIVHHIWIGAATNEEKGAFAIYHGEKDERNYTQIYEKKDQLEDLEYAYVLVSIVYKAFDCMVF